MADPLPTPPVSEPISYRPLSGFAIAGFAASCLFALLVLGVAVVALIQGAPFFYSLWVLLLPAAGLVLSMIARNQIRSSEGTRAGESLARAGVWIGLMTGLGYFVYYSVTGLALTSQANEFLMTAREDSGFFAHLQKAAESTPELYAAFLLTLPASSRGNVKPGNEEAMLRVHDQASADGTPGRLTLFRNNSIIRVFTTAAPGQIKVEPLGVQTWAYEERSYIVHRTYRVTTPEAVIEFPVITRSTEGETSGEARKWYVETNKMGRPEIARTDLGKGLRVLRALGHAWLNRWGKALNDGESFALAEVDATRWSALRLGDAQRGYVKAKLQDLFGGKEPNRLAGLSFPADEEPLGDWEIVGGGTAGKVRLGLPFRWALAPEGKESAYMVDGRLVIETKAPVDLEAMVRAKAPPEQLDWTIQKFIVTRAAPPPLKKGP
jgi:hypothetical protein